MGPLQGGRRGFKSRSSSGAGAGGDGPTRRGWGSVTRHQISGHRFQIRRLANGMSLRDTRMLADPLRRQSRVLTVGALLTAVMAAIAVVISILKPAGLTGNHPILAERNTNALYVVVNNELHPVLNLASARLIAGKPENPAVVKSSEIDKFPLGNTLGIPGAPARMEQSADRDSRWLVCDALAGPFPGTTVIVGDPVAGAGHAAAMAADSAVLASSGDATWLIWGNKRARIDLTDAAVVSSLGINLDTPTPRPLDRQLLNLIPETSPLTVPFVPNAGDPPRFVWPTPASAPLIGSVILDHENNAVNYFAVTADGLQPISSVVAAMLRANNAYGLVEPPALTPDQVAKAPRSDALAVTGYPDTGVKVVDSATDPVLCGQWSKIGGTPTSALVLLSGQSLPIADDASPVSLAQSGPTTAARVVMPKGSGFYVQVTGQQPQSATKEAQFWISDLGLRYGIEDAPNQPAKTAEALGMTRGPLPIPWAVASLMQAGPTLSKDDALVAH